MGLRIKSTKVLGHRIATLMAVFALVAQPMYGLVASQLASAAPLSQTVYDTLMNTATGQDYGSFSTNSNRIHELGDRPLLAGSARKLDTVSFNMSSWTLREDQQLPLAGEWCANNPGRCTDEGFTYPMTAKVYSGDLSTELGAVTQDVFIPWRPVGDTDCLPTTNGPSSNREYGWKIGDNCIDSSGIGFIASFDFSSRGLVVPGDAVYSISYNTRVSGIAPTGVQGPIDKVNVSLNGNTAAASVGQDYSTGHMYANYNSGSFKALGWGTGYNLGLRVTATTDGVAPTVKVNLDRKSFVSSRAHVSQDKNPEIQASDNSGIDRIEITKEGSSTPSHVWRANGSKDRRANISFLGDGRYIIVAYDTSGSVSQPFIINLDKTNPTTDLIVPEGVAGNVFRVSGTAKDNKGLSRVYVQLVNRENSQRYGGTTINLSGAEAKWAHDYNAQELNIPEGTYAAHVQATDLAGNRYDEGWSKNFTLDKTAPDAPVLSVKTRTNGTVLANGGYTNWKDIVTSWDKKPDGEPVRYVYTYWNNIETSPWNNDNRYEVPTTSLSAGGSFNQGEGVHYMQVFAYDAVGNKSGSDVFEITYDKTSPQAVIAAPTNSVDVTKPFTISGTYSDSLSGVSRLHLYVSSNGKSLGSPFIVSSSQLNSKNGTFSYALTQKDLDRLSDSSFGLGNGDTFTVRANVFDRANNWSNFEQTFTVANPTVNGDYFTVHEDSIAVGFTVDRLIGATKVEVELFDASGKSITKNVGDKDAMKNLLNSYSGQISSPFFIPGRASDIFWTFGEADWKNVMPKYAVVTVFYGNDQKVSSDRVEFEAVNVDQPLQNYAALTSSLPGVKSPVEPDDQGDDKGPAPEEKGDAGNEGAITADDEGRGSSRGRVLTPLNPGVLAVLDQASAVTDSNDDDGEVLAEEDNAQENTTNATAGEVLADEAQAGECGKFLGLCWYWWFPIIGAVAIAGFVIRGMIREDEALPARRRQ